MKTISKLICSISILGLLACTSSSPSAGTGPGFPEGTTAADLFSLVTVGLYVPDSLTGDETYNEGTDDCTDGGSATVEDARGDNSENSTITFKNCDSQFAAAGVTIGGANNVSLEQDGTVYYYLTATDLDNPTDAKFFYRHQLSYSGDIGFAADCEFVVTSDETASGGGEIKDFDGSCTYTDSEGNELSINGDEMLETVQD